MKMITLGKTDITVPQNAFGCLPIQRIDTDAAVRLLRRAREGGMLFFDTARAYTDSEIKVGKAFAGMRDQVILASKTAAVTPEVFWKDLETTLSNLQTDYLDLYQLHCVERCYRPGDGTGMYECMLEAKAQGKIRHIGITAHKIGVAEEIIASGLYETLQFPFSYLSGDREVELVKACEKADMGFICMKAIAGGLLTNAKAAAAYLFQFDNILPIWGIQKEEELDQWLALFEETPVMDEEIREIIRKDREELSGEFCRGCGYCAPCTVGIDIHSCARMSLMVRRAPSDEWLNEKNQAEMNKIPDCVECGLCMERCPYGLPIPQLLRRNYEDYQNILAGRTKLWNYG